MDTVSKRRGDKIIIIFVLLLVALVLSQAVSAYMSPPTATLHLGDGKFKATIADTEALRTKGLSGTRRLPENEAMVLVFDGNTRRGIWMKDMNYAIDVVWLNESKQVVDYVIHVPPESYPKTFQPKEDARYTVELKSGTIEAKGIRVGDRAVFSGTKKDL